MPDLGGCPGSPFLPSEHQTDADAWPGAGGSGHVADFSRFVGTRPNGRWQLLVVDDDTTYQEGGKLALGWSLGLTTAVPDALVPAPLGGGFADRYPLTRTVSGVAGLIDDVDVSLSGVHHARPDDLDLLLVGPEGQKVILMSDACGSAPVFGRDWGWNEQAFTTMSDSGDCPTGGYFPTDHEPGESLPGAAPVSPYATTLAAFDDTDPNGEWRLYAYDDHPLDAHGFFAERFQLVFGTRPKSPVSFTTPAIEVAEGSTGLLTLRRKEDKRDPGATLRVITAPGSATPGRDFPPVATTVEFAPGEFERTISIAALADADDEGAESFTVTIEEDRGNAIPADTATTAVVTIADRTPAPAATAAPTPSGTVAADRVAPVVSRLAVRGTRLTYHLSETAAVAVRIQGRIVKTLRRNGRAGANSVRFKRPRSGYRVTVTAIDAAGNRSSTSKRVRSPR